MPNNVTDSPRDEEKWEKAEGIAKKQLGHAPKSDKDWAYVMGIYKKMKPDHQFKSEKSAATKYHHKKWDSKAKKWRYQYKDVLHRATKKLTRHHTKGQGDKAKIDDLKKGERFTGHKMSGKTSDNAVLHIMHSEAESHHQSRGTGNDKDQQRKALSLAKSKAALEEKMTPEDWHHVAKHHETHGGKLAKEHAPGDEKHEIKKIQHHHAAAAAAYQKLNEHYEEKHGKAIEDNSPDEDKLRAANTAAMRGAHRNRRKGFQAGLAHEQASKGKAASTVVEKWMARRVVANFEELMAQQMLQDFYRSVERKLIQRPKESTFSAKHIYMWFSERFSGGWHIDFEANVRTDGRRIWMELQGDRRRYTNPAQAAKAINERREFEIEANDPNGY